VLQVHHLHRTAGVTDSVLFCLKHRTDKKIVRCDIFIALITKIIIDRSYAVWFIRQTETCSCFCMKR